MNENHIHSHENSFVQWWSLCGDDLVSILLTRPRIKLKKSPSNIPSSKYTSAYFSQLNRYAPLPYMGPGRIASMVSNPTCLGDGCSKEMDLDPLIMKFPAVPQLVSCDHFMVPLDVLGSMNSNLCKIMNQSSNIKIVIIIIIIPIIWTQIPDTWNRNPQYLFPSKNSDNSLSISCNINSSSCSCKPTSS